MRLLYHPDIKTVSLSGVLYALGDPIRLAIVQRLDKQDEIACAALEIPIAKSTLSHHFKILRDAGVLYCRKEGTQHINSLRRHELEARFPGLLKTVLECANAGLQRDEMTLSP
jgi:DNA-binding transcriptional ArsR family regulator